MSAMASIFSNGVLRSYVVGTALKNSTAASFHEIGKYVAMGETTLARIDGRSNLLSKSRVVRADLQPIGNERLQQSFRMLVPVVTTICIE
jgi:hypothetical protein